MSLVFTIQAKAVEKIVRHASSNGVTADRLYEAVGLNSVALLDPDSRIPFSQLVELYEKAALLTGDSDFGLHLGETVDLKVFDVLGYTALNSATLGDAFARVARYHSIWTDGATFTLERAERTSAVMYRYVDQSIAVHRQDSEVTFAAVTELCRKLLDRPWTPLAVEFQHGQPDDIAEHERIFGCAVTFGSVVNRLDFASNTLTLPVAKADPGLCALLDRHAEELLAKYPRRDSIIDRTRIIIGDELKGGDPSLERVAAQLGFSARTLQRKLHESGTSHNELLDQMRSNLAKRYLREPEMAISEVAYLLGFSEPSSFHRAFKRWTGLTPREFRIE